MQGAIGEPLDGFAARGYRHSFFWDQGWAEKRRLLTRRVESPTLSRTESVATRLWRSKLQSVQFTVQGNQPN
jgi:hypothetical protein